jgi:SAM-dependent methyltransferase
MGDREALARTFERSAELYDEVRPGYPEALFDDLERLSGVPAGGRILEIGCGTGKATLPLARRGYRILCLEPGANLAAIARRKLAPFPSVEVRTCTFEEWEPEREAFDLVVAATSFEWLDPAVRYRKTAEALRPGGCVAVFWNAHVAVPGADRFFEVNQEVYRRHAPEMAGAPLNEEDLPTTVDDGFIDPGGFEAVGVRHYPWSETYDTGRYLKLLQTFSDHLALPDPRLRCLLQDIGGLIDHEFGGRVPKHSVAVLQVARKLG